MSWARFDDRYDDHPKVKRAWRRHPAAVGLHAMAITYSTRHLTDGLIGIEWLEEKLPRRVEREKCLVALIGSGLLERVDDHTFRVHDFLEYNESRAEREAARAEERERKRAAGRKGGLTKAANARSQAKTPNGSASSGLAGASPPLEQTPSSPAKASLARTAPHLNSTSEHEKTATERLHVEEGVEPSRLDAARERMKASEEVVALCALLAELIAANDPKAKVAPQSARWLHDMRLLVSDREGDAAEVERVLRWSQADAFWHSNILSPGKLREKFTQLRSKMVTEPPGTTEHRSIDDIVARAERREQLLEQQRRDREHAAASRGAS